MQQINQQRLLGWIDELGQIGAIDGGGVCRLALSDEDKAGRDYVVGLMKSLGLEVKIDRIGNVLGLREGQEDLPPVMTGSHIDTVRTGGRYDGNLGVLAGLEVIATLNDLGIQSKRPLGVAFFTNEEGSRFAPDMMGSLVFQGDLALETALAVRGIDGTTVQENLQRIGYAGDWISEGQLVPTAFVELHIEQGPVLEEETITIGAVQSVQGISWTEYTFKGVSNHAGTTPMRLRHDAGYAACQVASFLRALAEKVGDDQVATVGRMEFKPNLVNVIANHAVFTVDLRNTDNEKLKFSEQQTLSFINELCEKEGLECSSKTLARFDPVIFNDVLVNRIESFAKELGHSVKRMPSGAGHDAQMLARMCPSSMIFIPSKAGISHNVKEYSSPEHIEAGANILLNLLMELAQA
ncbi:MAG: M20 family metallo-hydrolase [Myxococcales bacterium]|nr:MAG: M20 family metallo-hydrolase [Myxococcales bacterium]